MKKAIYRLLINWYQASDNPLPAWLERACDKDANLANERGFGDELTRALKRHPNDGMPPAEGSMASRVLRQLAEEDYCAEQEQRSASPAWGAWVRGAGISVAAVALALAAYRFLDTSNSRLGGEGDVIAIDENQATDGLGEDLLELGENWKNPLDQEIDYIVSDAKGALGFLATSFVPSSYLKKAESDKKA